MTGGRAVLPPAVITGLCDPMILAMARSLGRRGISITGVDADITEIYGRSRHIRKRVHSRAMYDSSLIDTLADLGRSREGRAVLINTTDKSVLNVSEHRERLAPWYDFVLPRHNDIVNLVNKRTLHRFAVEQGIPVPETHFPGSAQELASLAGEIGYPCIVKPEIRSEDWMTKIRKKTLLVRSREELLGYMERRAIGDWKLIVQKWIPGSDSELFFCLCYIDREGRPRAACTGRKRLQHPPGSGSTSVAETVESGELRERSLALLKAGKCTGLCSVEFKREGRSGTFWLVEPTVGRPDTQVGTAVSAGVDLPYIAYLDAAGLLGEPDNPPGVRPVRWINEPLFIDNLIGSFPGRETLSALGLLKSRNLRFAVASFRDPLPSLLFHIRLVGSLLRKTAAALARLPGRAGGSQR